MRLFFDQRQYLHAPVKELNNGAFMDFAETTTRLDSILAAIGPTEPVVDHGEAPIRAVHGEDYLAFLWSAWKDWRAAGRSGDAAGYVWPITRRRPLDLDRIDARIGRFSYDASTPVASGTWESAYWSAQTSLTALDSLAAGGDEAAFALCRPPGHHCGSDYLGGYCYLNNAAIAAESAAASGRRVAILDVDYHHGNGTQDIFFDRDLLFVSIHADPRLDYPFFWGHSDEIGEGAGEGANLNLPLKRGTSLSDYEPALDRALEAVAAHGADLLVCSYGADTYVGDPISHFALTTEDYALLARRIAQLRVPTLVVMEGGYNIDALGRNVASFLSGF